MAINSPFKFSKYWHIDVTCYNTTGAIAITLPLVKGGNYDVVLTDMLLPTDNTLSFMDVLVGHPVSFVYDNRLWEIVFYPYDGRDDWDYTFAAPDYRLDLFVISGNTRVPVIQQIDVGVQTVFGSAKY